MRTRWISASKSSSPGNFTTRFSGDWMAFDSWKTEFAIRSTSEAAKGTRSAATRADQEIVHRIVISYRKRRDAARMRNPECLIHQARKSKPSTDPAFKTEQEKRRREEAIAQVAGLRVLEAIANAVPIRRMKRDLAFIVERLLSRLDDARMGILLKRHNLKKAKGSTEPPVRILTAFVRKADESTLGRLLVEYGDPFRRSHFRRIGKGSGPRSRALQC